MLRFILRTIHKRTVATHFKIIQYFIFVFNFKNVRYDISIKRVVAMGYVY